MVSPLQKRAVGDCIYWSEGSPGIKATNQACYGRLCLSYCFCIFFLLSESCSALALNIPVNKGQRRLCWQTLQAQWGCFVYTSVNCAVWHTQLDPVHLPTTHLPTDFLKGALNAQSSMCMRDVANNYLCVVFILAIRQLTETQLYVFLCFFLPDLFQWTEEDK